MGAHAAGRWTGAWVHLKAARSPSVSSESASVLGSLTMRIVPADLVVDEKSQAQIARALQRARRVPCRPSRTQVQMCRSA
jgi:hypothetical protein